MLITRPINMGMKTPYEKNHSENTVWKNSETKNWSTNFNPENYKRPIKLSYDLIDSKTNKKILAKGELKAKIDISANFISKQAQSKIEKLGGKINLIKK